MYSRPAGLYTREWKIRLATNRFVDSTICLQPEDASISVLLSRLLYLLMTCALLRVAVTFTVIYDSSDNRRLGHNDVRSSAPLALIRTCSLSQCPCDMSRWRRKTMKPKHQGRNGSKCGGSQLKRWLVKDSNVDDDDDDNSEVELALDDCGAAFA